MGPKVLSSDTHQRTDGSRRRFWLPGILLALGLLIALFGMGGAASAQEGPEGVQSDPWAIEFCKTYGMQCAMGDFNGDGRDDIIQFNHSVSPAGYVYVRLSTGSGFGPALPWHTTFCVGSKEICKVADFNGDHKDDVITFVREAGKVWVALSSGSGFGEARIWLSDFCAPGEICDVGDYNGDGLDDVTAFTRNLYYQDFDRSWGKVFVATSDGGKFNKTNDNEPWIKHFCASWEGAIPEVCGSGDFNGDGKDDIVAFSKTGAVWVSLSTGSGFGSSSMWTPSDKAFCVGAEVCGIGDFNADGKDDIIAYLQSLYEDKIGWVYVGLSNGGGFPKDTITLWDNYFCLGSQQCGSGAYINNVGQTSYSQAARTGDFNGDCIGDVVAFLRSTEPSTKPGWVYVKLGYGSHFVDVIPTNPVIPPAGPVRAWLPLAAVGRVCR
jgi:hypothetical protein